ncbi:recombinase family protein [Bradyrhizobium sp. S69]|uniref:recombinase family protein n=1 Tax=Bradyrhizobium sp. S69 TaxID=1641856 RepID=UPI00131A7CE5|nr:recombinase family protein [Bradyrhizobium sp. S69]
MASQVNRERAIGYGRVSTRRQAANITSLNEQAEKIQAFCDTRNRELVTIFVDPGLSGRTDRRPKFKEMIQFACDPKNCIREVIVYNFSRYFRNPQMYLQYKNQLKAAGVRLLSATQEIPAGPTGELLETILCAFDGHASEVNAEVVRDVMCANAEDGFFNGSSPPYGHKTEVVAVLRKKEKKKLVLDDKEAAIVRLIFRLCLGQQDGLGELGIKAIASYLNKNGYRRRGHLFYTASIERILKSETCIGIRYFNRVDSRTRKPRPRSEWIEIKVPAIIDRDTFAAAQRTLKRRRPSETPARITNGPTLLAGLAVCGRCGAGMQLRTGKSGQYRYLTCSGQANKGKIACEGQSIRMEKADELVLSAVEGRVFEPARLSALIGKMATMSAGQRDGIADQLHHHRNALQDATKRLARIYDAIEDGFSDHNDKLLRERVDSLRLQRMEHENALAKLSARKHATAITLTPEKLARFSDAMRLRLRTADPGFRRAWLRLFVAEVCIGPDRIRLAGPDDAIFGLIEQHENLPAMVPNIDRNWRARRDSNS